jgi:hypothetical protein
LNRTSGPQPVSASTARSTTASLQRSSSIADSGFGSMQTSIDGGVTPVWRTSTKRARASARWTCTSIDPSRKCGSLTQ